MRRECREHFPVAGKDGVINWVNSGAYLSKIVSKPLFWYSDCMVTYWIPKLHNSLIYRDRALNVNTVISCANLGYVIFISYRTVRTCIPLMSR